MQEEFLLLQQYKTWCKKIHFRLLGATVKLSNDQKKRKKSPTQPGICNRRITEW